MNKIQLLFSRTECDKYHKKVCLRAKGYGNIEEGKTKSSLKKQERSREEKDEDQLQRNLG